MRVEAEIAVARPRPEVFSYLKDAARLPEYMTEFELVEQVSEGPPRVGTQYRYRMARGQAKGTFEWLSAPPNQFTGDLQEWIRNSHLDPDWLRVGTDIVGGATPPKFNASFSLAGRAP